MDYYTKDWILYQTVIDFTQLENNSYKASSININFDLFDENGKKDSNLYSNKNNQENILNRTINNTNLFTLRTPHGKLIFLNAPNIFFFQIGFKSISKPVYESNFYLGKDIEIIFEVLDDEFKTRKISVIFL
jgi:hypothetical protein